MLSNLIVDIEVLRSLVTQNGQKIGKVENDIKNKSEANENAHQDIEGTNLQVVSYNDLFLRSLTPIKHYRDRTMIVQ